MQEQPAMRAVTVSIRLEGQQCAMELGVPGCGHVPREWHLNRYMNIQKTIQIYMTNTYDIEENELAIKQTKSFSS